MYECVHRHKLFVGRGHAAIVWSRSSGPAGAATIFITFYYEVVRVPIHIDEFNGQSEESLCVEEGSQPHQLLTFLAEHSDHAFRQSELADETGIKRGSVGAALSRLEDRGLVRHRGRYWAIAADDRLAAYAAQTAASSVSTTDDYYGEEE